MKWVTDAGFTFTEMSPAEMILSRHVEILREDDAATKSLVKLFGGEDLDPLAIKCVPLGPVLDLLELGQVPALFCTLPIVDRQPGPGVNSEIVTVRDVIRFHHEGVVQEQTLWTCGFWTVVSHLIGVVQSSANLPYDTDTNGADVGIVNLASRVDLSQISLEQVVGVDSGSGANLWDLNIDFAYRVNVNAKTIPPRLWPLVTVGA